MVSGMSAPASPRLARVLLVSAAALAGAVALFAILGYLVAPGIAKSKLEEILTRELGRTTTVERVEVRPFALAATVHGLAVREPDGQAPALTVEAIEADASIASVTKLAPVLDALAIVRPHLRIARVGANRYSVSDLIEKWSAPSDAPPAKYSLNNIEVRDGRVEFEDRPLRRTHVVERLEVGVPFLSTLPHDVEINVEPKLGGVANGTAFGLAGKATPFADERRAFLDIDVDELPLARYVEYAPVRLRVAVRDARLTTRLKLHFAQPKGGAATWWMDGEARLAALDVRRLDGAPLVALERVNAGIERLDPGARELRIASVDVDAPSVTVRRLEGGVLELAGDLFERSPSAAAGTAPAAAPWKVTIATVTLANGRGQIEDTSVAPAYRAGVSGIRGRATGLSNAPGAKAAVGFSLDVDDGAHGELEGEVSLTPFAAAGRFSTTNASLARLYPYVAEILDVAIQRGRADFAASFEIAPGGGVKIAGGRGALADVALAQRDEREPLWRSAKLAFDGVALDTRTRSLTIDGVDAERLYADLRRDRDGSWNYARLVRTTHDTGAAAQDEIWQFLVKRASAARGEVRFRDLAGKPPIDLRLDDVNLVLTNGSNVRGAKGAIDFGARVNRTGRVKAKGPLATNPVAATLAVEASSIALLPFRRYVEDNLNVTLTSGTASARGTLDMAFPGNAPARLRWSGNLALENFGADDPPTGNRLLGWRVLRVDGAKANLDPFEASADGVTFEDFYARVIVYADGTLNLAKLARSEGEASASDAGAPQASPAASGRRRVSALAGATRAVGSAAAAAGATLRRASDDGLPLSVGRITLAGGNVNFSDYFIRPNYSANLTSVSGTVSAMSPTQAGEIDIQAKLDDAAPVEIRGHMQPFARELSFDIAGKARDIELPPLSPYSAKYAGYGITRGKMSFDVDYKVENRKLDARNRLVLDQLTFGEKVDSPEATKLPVLFAVSLLKDARGVIDLDIPISGTLDDPQFSMFAIVVKVIVNLLTKAATAPFALLSSIAGGAGGAGEDLAFLEFAAGSAIVEGEAAARVERLAKALANRPALKVDVSGRVDPASDAEGLERAALERELRETKFAAVAGTPDEVASADAVKLTPEERARWIDWLYRNTPIEGRPRDAAGALAAVAPAEMESRLAKHFAPPVGALEELGLRRARAAKEALVAGGMPAERVFLVAPKAADGPAKGSPRRVDFALR
jgi:hypothetical protein